MKAVRTIRVRFGVMLVGALALFALTGAAAPAAPAKAPTPAVQEEIPITTSSAEARELFVKARQLAANNHNPEARKVLEQAIAKDPNFALAYVYQAMMETDTNKGLALVDNAAALADKTKVSDGERMWLKEVQLYWKGLHDLRVENFHSMVKAYPKDRWALLNLGLLFIFTQEDQKAVEQLSTLTQQAPDFAPAYSGLGSAQKNLGNFADAEKSLKKYTELLPKDAAAWDSYGWLLAKQSKFDESIAAFDKALSLDPKYAPSLLGQGLDLVLKGKPADGRKLFAEAAELAQDDWWRQTACYALSISYLFEKKVDQAVVEQQKAFALYEKKKDLTSASWIAMDLGHVLAQSARAKEAQAQFSKALDLLGKSAGPEEAKASIKGWMAWDQALMALKADDLKTAKLKADEFKAFAEKYGTPGRRQGVHQLAGMIALKEKRWDDAVAELNQAPPRSCMAMVGLAEAYLAKGDKDKARQQLTKAANFNEIDLEFGLTRSVAKDKLAKLK